MTMVTGMHASAVAKEFLVYAQEERAHADQLASLLCAVEPDTGKHTLWLSFVDDIPGHPDAGQEVHA